jgi:hypothetical protein
MLCDTELSRPDAMELRERIVSLVVNLDQETR